MAKLPKPSSIHFAVFSISSLTQKTTTTTAIHGSSTMFSLWSYIKLSVARFAKFLIVINNTQVITRDIRPLRSLTFLCTYVLKTFGTYTGFRYSPCQPLMKTLISNLVTPPERMGRPSRASTFWMMISYKTIRFAFYISSFGVIFVSYCHRRTASTFTQFHIRSIPHVAL